MIGVPATCTGAQRIRRNPGRSDAPDRTTTNPRPNFCVGPLANDALNPHDRKAGREGRPIFRSTRSSPAMCVSPSMRIPPLRCPALRVGRFSALNKRPFPSRIFLLPKSQAHKKGITLDRFSPDQSRKEKVQTASLFHLKSFRGCLGRNALKSIDRTFQSRSRQKIRGRDHSHVVLPKFCHRRGSSSARSA